MQLRPLLRPVTLFENIHGQLTAKLVKIFAKCRGRQEEFLEATL